MATYVAWKYNPRQHRLLGYLRYLGSVPAVPGPFFQVDSVDSLCLDKAVVEVSQAVVVLCCVRHNATSLDNRITELQVEWGFSDVEGSFLTSVVNLGFCCSTSVW